MKSILIISVFLISSNVFSQNAKYYFSPEKSIQYVKGRKVLIYEVSRKNIYVPKIDTIKTITSLYLEKEKELEKLKNDSIKAFKTPEKKKSSFFTDVLLATTSVATPNGKNNQVETQRRVCCFQIQKKTRELNNIKKYDFSYESSKTDSISIVSYVIGNEYDVTKIEGLYEVIDYCYPNFESNDGQKKQIFLKSDKNQFDKDKSYDYTLISDASGSKKYLIEDTSIAINDENIRSAEDLKKFNDEYLNWKSTNIGLIKSAKNNIKICNSIIEKYSFTNIFGKRVYNEDAISTKDKLEFNVNHDKIVRYLEEKVKLLESGVKYDNYLYQNAKEREDFDDGDINFYILNTNRMYVD